MTNRGIGHILSKYAYFHNVEMIYAIMLLMGFTGLFVDRVLLKSLSEKYKNKDTNSKKG